GSLLIKAISYHDKDMQMPPEKKGGQLAAAVIADFEQWVKMGAPDPRESKMVAKNLDLEKGREHWAFQLPKNSAAPAVKDKAWPHNDVDRQVLATLESKGLKPVGDADPTTFIRRLYFDLVGLPPTPAEAEDFVKKCAAAADKKSGPLPQSVVATTVDKLLASPQFGERWGRHWLDVARYGESSGKEVNITYPHAWRYRDYVIDAFNTDKPYDRFLKEQLAGDLMSAPNSTDKALQEIATGFLAIGPKSHNTREARQFLLDVADEQIDTMSQGMLGLTVACARCHDHKFDPIPTQDYYALAGIFLSTETRYGTARFIQNNQPSALVRLPDDAYVNDAEPMGAQESAIIRRQLENAKKSRDEILAAARANGGQAALMGDVRLIRDNTQITIFEQMLGRQDSNGQTMRLAMGVQDRLAPQDTRILVRGEMDKASDTVSRGFVQVVNTAKPMPKIQKGSGRLELAEWIASPENPLTARVMVNRVWLHLFGRGIVASPNNFGVTGQAPTHPALLDQLSISFVENGWSVKKLVRELVLSHTYQLAATHNVAAHAVDPENTLYWRMSPRRLDAEAIRDAMLAAAGRLTLTPPKGSEIAKYEGPVNVLQRFGATQREHNYRSVYLPIVRDQVPEALAVFDFAEPSLVVGEREETSVPSQALYLLNNANVQRLSEAMADRLLQDAQAGPDRAKLAFQLTFGRPPTATELKSSSEFFSRFATVGTNIERSADNRTALVAFCQALLGSAEFRYLY
ncbi:MAG TPA: DUF1549 and DUF1553 domain-containing protein, partial [Roseimicrobium sp.]|nr:DUF1549 and DUF1553 domain-containing protein [Roseimicrobium sp.]